MLRPLLVAVVVATALAAPAATASTTPGRCVLLMSAYPAEINANLSREKLDPAQPQKIAGVEFFSGALSGKRVVLALAGKGTVNAHNTTTVALQHFACISAVAFSGTAGGGGRTQLGDVSVPDHWSLQGKQPMAVSKQFLAGATGTASAADRQFETTAAVNVGPCDCAVGQLQAVPLLRTPKVVMGGTGLSEDDGNASACTAGGGELEGCQPCPTTSTSPALSRVPVTSPAEATRLIGAEPGMQGRIDEFQPAAPASNGTTGGTDYVADDEETASAMQVALAHGKPFIAFRGISDTSAVGDLWPAEYVVYQQLAADNAAAAAREWLTTWS